MISKIYQNMVLSQATVHLSFGQKIRLLCQHQAIALEPKPSPEAGLFLHVSTVTVPEVLWLFFRAPFRSQCELSKPKVSTEDPIVVSKRALPT
jgi:hypothetical protein